MLAYIKPKMEERGIKLKIIEIDDYNIPNRALSEKEVDANFFQHKPFMDQQIKNFGYKIECYARIHLEPMAIYSNKFQSLKDLPEQATVALPNDPTNEYRALSILVENGLITMREGSGIEATVADILTNPKNLKFREVDAALLPRALVDVDAAAIPTNYALQAKLNPTRDALAVEKEDSPYANIIAIRVGDGGEPKLEMLRKEMLSEEMKAFILKKYQGAIIPVLKEDCLP